MKNEKYKYKNELKNDREVGMEENPREANCMFIIMMCSSSLS